jgi:hypothetical protein
MARDITIGGRRFWVLSEPDTPGWIARVVEVLNEGKSTRHLGIEATGDTRQAADDRALGFLQQHIRRSSPLNL